MNQSAAVARLSNATKTFGTKGAVNGLSLSVAGGEIYGLLGPNGAGKSTALLMLAGLLSPTGGIVEVAGFPSDSLSAKRNLGYLGASAGLFGRLSPRETLVYFGRVHDLPRARIDERIRDLTLRLGLSEVIDRRCEVLSTGERQRVSIARAVLHDPALLIPDEPTSGLDVLASRFLRDFIRAERSRGKAVIFSTHYLTEADLLCDRVGFLHHGFLLDEGTPADLRGRHGGASLEEAFLAMAQSEVASL
jgi:sodium transport system ATP-binding protein